MPTVGVAGFLLGGGISTLSARYGFGADIVSAWEVNGLVIPPLQHIGQGFNDEVPRGRSSRHRETLCAQLATIKTQQTSGMLSAADRPL